MLKQVYFHIKIDKSLCKKAGAENMSNIAV